MGLILAEANLAPKLEAFIQRPLDHEPIVLQAASFAQNHDKFILVGKGS